MPNKNIVEKDYQPIQEGNKYSLVNSPITKEQILQIFAKTPEQHIHQRPAKGGGTWSYVTGVYVKKALHFLFGFLWDFEIIDKGNVEVGGKIIQVWVQGKLTIRNPKTFEPMILKTQFGGADVKYMKSNPKQPLDYANDMKAAATDALKKCAAELGIASDVYGKNEFKEIKEGGKAKPEKQAKPQPQTAQVDYVKKLLDELEKKGAHSLPEKIATFNKITGLNIKSLNIAQQTAKKYLMSLLSSPMGK